MMHQLCNAASDGDTATVGTLLSTSGAQSLINYQDTRVGPLRSTSRPDMVIHPSQHSLLQLAVTLTFRRRMGNGLNVSMLPSCSS